MVKVAWGTWFTTLGRSGLGSVNHRESSLVSLLHVQVLSSVLLLQEHLAHSAGQRQMPNHFRLQVGGIKAIGGCAPSHGQTEYPEY